MAQANLAGEAKDTLGLVHVKSWSVSSGQGLQSRGAGDCSDVESVGQGTAMKLLSVGQGKPASEEEDILEQCGQVPESSGRDPDRIVPLVAECVEEGGSILIFCSSRKQCEKCADMLADLLPGRLKVLPRCLFAASPCPLHGNSIIGDLTPHYRSITNTNGSLTYAVPHLHGFGHVNVRLPSSLACEPTNGSPHLPVDVSPECASRGSASAAPDLGRSRILSAGGSQ